MSSRFSFRHGFMQVKNKDLQDVKQKIMTAIGVETRAAWLNRLNGKVEPKVSEAEAIEAIFRQYGITKVWGEITRGELKDRKEHVLRETQELVHFAYLMLGFDGLDKIAKEVQKLTNQLRSGRINVDQIVTE